MGIASIAYEDHPRVSGENQLLLDRVRDGRGSSPRERGKRGENGDLAHHTGIIPA